MNERVGLLKHLGAAFAILCATAPQTFASEPTAPPSNWSGFYAGVQAGYGWGNNTYTFTPVPESTDVDVGGWVGGATLGVNWQRGTVVFGIEGDASFSDLGGYENTRTNPAPTTPCLLFGPTQGCSGDVNWFATLRARAGVAMGSMMPFVTGGLAVAGVEGFADTGACGGPVCRYDETKVGWVVGGGLEAMLRDGWTVKVEYLYVDLGEPKFTAPTVQADNIDFSVIRAGLNFRF